MPEAPNPKIRPTPSPPLEKPIPCALPYAELDVTTNFSFLHGASHPDELVFRAAELGHRAIAVTDRNSLAGAVRMYEAAKQCNMKLLVGSRLTFTEAPDVLVWTTNRGGYARLCRLLTLGRRRAEKGECELHLSDLLEYEKDLLLAIAPTNSHDDAWIDSLRTLREAVGERLSLAVSCLLGPCDAWRLRELNDVSKAFSVPLVATNAVHYHVPSRRPLQDVLTCTRNRCTIQEAGFRLFPNGERYLKSPEQMYGLFASHPQALHRTMEIVEQCHFSLDELKYEYPDEIVPAGLTPIQHLSNLSWQGAADRYPQGVPQTVREQIEHELQLIELLKYEPYFLTVYDAVRFARSRNILCQGRGSAANSAVCYCLGITSVNPNQIDVLFERFISAARNEPPDIDIDFEHERREEVIQYIYEKYGRERACMTATVITYRGRSAVRDVGKALGLSEDTVGEMAKKLDWWESGKMGNRRLRECGLDPSERTVCMVVELAGELLGFPRHLSQHVGGMVMTRGPLCELVPIENASMPGRTVIQWDKDDIDALGILKVDCLALGMLTCISKCLKLLDPPIELHEIPTEDPKVYEMCSNADTIGVFQIESRAQMSMLPRLRPKEFYDLVIEVAIVRPGPIQGDMVHPYLRRRNGEEPVEFPSPQLKKVLGKTLGVPLFQEHAMRIAIECAGFTPDEADRLRRAVTGFRRYGDIDTFEQKFISGMLARGYQKDFAERCFAQLKGFSTYGFPESHAASFALLVYASAWLKCHHPAEFACALLNSQPMGFYAPAQIVRDAREHGVEVRPVDVNHSNWDCTLEPVAEGKHALRLGFRQIKGISAKYVERVESVRTSGPFTSVAELHRRGHLPRHIMEKLAHADAFGSLRVSRRNSLWESLKLSNEQLPLFDQLPEQTDSSDINLPAMPIAQEVMTDYATAGLSLKQHPLALIRDHLTARRVVRAADLQQVDAGKWVKVAGLVLIRQRPGTASGIVFITLEDETGVANLIVRPNIFERYRPAARHASLLQCDGYVEKQGQVIHIMAKRMHDLSALLGDYALKSRDFR